MALDFKENFHRINYDIYTGVVESDYWGKQGDTGKGFEVTLWDDGQIFIPTTELLRINCKKPDGKRVWIDGELVGDKYRITLTNQVFVATGTVLAEFELISQGKSRKSETFVIEARESMKFGAVESETEYGYLEYLIIEIEKFKDESEIMRTAEEQRILNESNRIAQEDSRELNEDTRQTAESTRISSEDTRNTNETARISAESTRADNESTRQTNETGRVNAESTRVSQENTRESQETARVGAESSRVTVESGRVTAENTRVSQENTRKTNETARQTAESARATAETSRASAESTRVSQENTRKTQETGRVNAESSRASAESARVTAENTRSSQESTRQTNESARQSNESTRQTQEATRQSQEDTRQTNTATALANMEDAVESTVIIWKEAVSTYSAIATTYPNPEIGWRVETNDTKKAYRYDGTSWVNIADSTLTFTPENSANKGQPDGYAPLDSNSKVPSANLPPLNYIPTSEKGVASGVATLGTDGKVPSTQLPPLDYAPSSHTHSIANVTGLQSALDGKVDDSQVLTDVPAGAKFTDTVYTHPSTHPATMITEDSSHRFVTDAEKTTWNTVQDMATSDELHTFQSHVSETYIERSALLNMVYPIGSIYMSTGSTNPSVLFGGTWQAIEDRFLLASSSSFQTGTTGGSMTKTLATANLPSHSHTINHDHASATTSTADLAHTHSVSGTSGSGGVAHTHTVSGTTSNGGVAHTHSIPALSGTAASAGSHDHDIRYKGFALTASSSGWMVLRRNETGDSYDGTDGDGAIAAGAHTHSVSTVANTTGGASAYTHSHTFSETTSGASAYSHTHSFSATSGAMSANGTHSHTLNLPEYTGNSGSSGSGTAFDIMPPYFVVNVWRRTA